MKIVVLFGEDNTASRARFGKIIDGIKKRGWEHIAIGNDQRLSELVVSESLFGEERLFSVSVGGKVPPKEYEWLSAHSKDIPGSLLLYFQGIVPAAIKKLLPKDTTFEEFAQKKEIFTFLDAVYPGNAQQAIALLHKSTEIDAPEMILAMLARHLRDVAWVKSGESGFSAPSWRVQKLQRQASKFSDEQLSSFVSALLQADLHSKTGQADLMLSLDIALLAHL